MIRLDLLGTVELSLDGEAPPRELTWRKNVGLLAYLARSPRGRRSRDHLVEAFWPDRDEKDSRHSLNEALRVIRKYLPDGVLETEGEQVALDTGGLSIDTEAFTAALEAGRPEDAAALVRGPFMAGFGIPESNTFEDWLSAERRLWARHAVDALVSVGEARLEEGDITAARRVADRANGLEPLADAPVRILMECDALAGNPSAAIAVYQAFGDELRRELTLEPPARLAALAERIAEQREVANETIRAEDSGLSRRMPLVGRGAQLKQVMDRIRRCRGDAEPSLLVVTGAPGTGKTRFSEEVVMRAELDGFRTARLRCDGSDQARPLEALRVLAADPAVAGDTDAAAGEEDATEEFGVRVRGAAEGNPLLLWIDDAQYLDGESFARLAPTERHFGASAVLVLLSAASDPPSPEVDALVQRIGRDYPGLAIELSPLESGDLERLARRALPDWNKEAIGRLSRRLLRDTGGFPLLAVDLLHALRLGFVPDDGDVPAAPWPQAARTMDQTFPSEMPAPLVAAIRVGFRRLSRDAQEVLKAGAIIDGRFTADRVGRALDVEPDRLHAALDELEWRRWLVGEPRGYTFVARLHRDVIVEDMMTAGQRSRLEERLTPT